MDGTIRLSRKYSSIVIKRLRNLRARRNAENPGAIRQLFWALTLNRFGALRRLTWTSLTAHWRRSLPPGQDIIKCFPFFTLDFFKLISNLVEFCSLDGRARRATDLGRH